MELAFPHLKPPASTWSERGEGEHVRLGGQRAVAAASLLREAWLGEAAGEAQAPLPWLRGVAYETRTPVAELMGPLRRTRTMAEGNGARGACSVRRNCTLVEGNGAVHTDSLRRYCTVRICNRRRRSPCSRNRGNLCCVIGQAGDSYTNIFRNKRRCPQQCLRWTGWVCRTAVGLSIAGAKSTWLARVRVSVRVVSSP